MGRTRDGGERGERADSERRARRRDPARREKRGREPRENARASSDEDDWSEEETRDRRRREARGARHGVSSASRDSRPREVAVRARRCVVAASPSASDVSSDDASASERSVDDGSSGESDAERDEPEQPRGLGGLWRIAGRGVIGGVLAARSALASTSTCDARSPSRTGAESDASSSAFESEDAFETETETESESESESEPEPEPEPEPRLARRNVVARRDKAIGRLEPVESERASSSSDSELDVETARRLGARGKDSCSNPEMTRFVGTTSKASKPSKRTPSDHARIQAALVRERLASAAARKREARREARRVAKTKTKMKTKTTTTLATSAAPETAPLLASAHATRGTRKPAVAGVSLGRLVLLSTVALLGVVMLSAGARSVFAATFGAEDARETRFEAERRDARREAPTAVQSVPFAVSESIGAIARGEARDAGVRALDVSARGLDRARVPAAEADAMVHAATAAAAEAKASRPSEARDLRAASTKPETASPASVEPASSGPETASPASVEPAADDDDDDSARQPRVTDDMTYEEKQAEFARFAKAEAERNDRIAAEAAERDRANAAGEETEASEVSKPTESTESTEPTEEEAPLPEATDSTSWPLVGAGQRLIVDVPDDVTQDATATIVTEEGRTRRR